MNNKKKYLGDGVYVRFNGIYIVLTTEDGEIIYLDESVLEAFQSYIKSLSEKEEEE